MSLMYRAPGGQWRAVNEQSYSDEDQLQRMLCDSPELVPLRGGERIRSVFIREAGLPGSGNSDLVGVDASGNIYLVECKLATNPEIRRKVIGQILEYASYLWQMSFTDFEGLFVRTGRKSLQECLGGGAADEWDYESFRTRVEENLQSGSFELLIAVDAMNAQLEQIIAYLSSREHGIRLQALALQLYGDGNIEVLSPRVYGQLGTKESGPSHLRKQTMEGVLESAVPTVRGKLAKLVEQWKERGNSVDPGTKGMSFKAQIGDERRYIFWAPQPEYINAHFSGLLQQGASEELIEWFRREVEALPGFEPDKVRTQMVPRAYLENLEESDIPLIVDTYQRFVEKWRSEAKALIQASK